MLTPEFRQKTIDVLSEFDLPIYDDITITYTASSDDATNHNVIKQNMQEILTMVRAVVNHNTIVIIKSKDIPDYQIVSNLVEAYEQGKKVL